MIPSALLFTDAQHRCLAIMHFDQPCGPECLWTKEFHPDTDLCIRCYRSRGLHRVDGKSEIHGVCDGFR